MNNLEGYHRSELQKKKNKFVWSEKCTEAFKNIKELLMKTPILKVPYMDKELLVCTDGYKEGIGGFLM
jgi:hypothetical protein